MFVYTVSESTAIVKSLFIKPLRSVIRQQQQTSSVGCPNIYMTFMHIEKGCLPVHQLSYANTSTLMLRHLLKSGLCIY